MAKSKKTKRIDAWMRRHEGEYECACGCGEDIIVLRKHYSAGIPNFIKGHNMQGDYNPQKENLKVQEESLWDRLTPEEQQRRLSQLKNFPRGEEHPNWAGGQYITDSGYRYILVNDHPSSVGGYMAEHRLVVEEWLRNNNPEHQYMELVDGLPCLKRDTVIHHRNEVKTDNFIENLVLMNNQSTHLAWHSTTKVEEEKFSVYHDRIYCPWIKRG